MTHKQPHFLHSLVGTQQPRHYEPDLGRCLSPLSLFNCFVCLFAQSRAFVTCMKEPLGWGSYGPDWLRSIRLRYLGWRRMRGEMIQVLRTSLGLEVQNETRWDFWADGSNRRSKLLTATQCVGSHLKWGLAPESCGRPLLGGTACSHVTVRHCTASAVVSLYSTTLGYMNTSHVLQSTSVSFAPSLGLKDLSDFGYLAFLQCGPRGQLWLLLRTEALFLSRLEYH